MQSTTASPNRLLLAALSAALGVASAACSNGNAGFAPSGDDGGDSASFGPEGGFGDDGAAPPACVSTVQTATLLPLDLLFLIDRSFSMDGPPFDATTQATLEFFTQGFRSPTQIGLQWIPYALEGSNVDQCQYRNYENLAVPLGPIASQRVPFESAIAHSILGVGSNGYGPGSPYYAALKGTYFAATKAQDAHPDHQVVVVVVGAGVINLDPVDCPIYGPVATDPAAMAALASAALHYDGVRTFGVTFNTLGSSNIQGLSKAGGGVVYNVAGNTTQDLLDAINHVARAAVQCAFRLPTPPQGQTLDTSRVQVQVDSSAAARTTLPEVSDVASCGQGAGWYYDNAAAPNEVLLCPNSCEALQADPIARVELVVACTIVTH